MFLNERAFCCVKNGLLSMISVLFVLSPGLPQLCGGNFRYLSEMTFRACNYGLHALGRVLFVSFPGGGTNFAMNSCIMEEMSYISPFYIPFWKAIFTFTSRASKSSHFRQVAKPSSYLFTAPHFLSLLSTLQIGYHSIGSCLCCPT